jgi:hypothetical protein
MSAERMWSDMSRTDYDVTPEVWPPEDQLEELLDAISGLFVFASTCLNFIDDPVAADPHSQLHSLLLFIRLSEVVASRNPLAALDLLYSRILESTPLPVLKTTRRILGYMSHKNIFYRTLDSAQALCNFFRLEQHDFHKAVRGLHSIMSVPDKEEAAKSQLQFQHTSFQDFLLNPNRSGKFAISKTQMLEDFLPFVLDWYGVDVPLFHASEGE